MDSVEGGVGGVGALSGWSVLGDGQVFGMHWLLMKLTLCIIMFILYSARNVQKGRNHTTQ